MDVRDWLRSLGLGQYEATFRDSAVDADVLPDLNEADLEKLGIPLGHRKRLLKAIAGLPPSAPAQVSPPVSAVASAQTGERRTLTVMFSDLVGSTALAASMDAEEWRDLVAAYHETVASAVAAFGGHVAQKMGDGALVYFGYPQAQENDAERGVRAGLAIQEELIALNRRLDADGAPELAARVGLHVGAVVIDAGSMAFGEVPNQAARVQTMAEAGEVLISEDVHRLVAGQFVVEDRGAHELKGVPRPVTLYRVARPSGSSRRRAGHALSPLLGRDEELAVFASRWRRARAGEGQVVTVIGEPGIGKSRLVDEFRAGLADTPHTWIEWPCSQLLANAPFHPLVEWARGRFGGPEQPAEARIGELERTLDAIKLDPAETVPLIAPVLDIPVPERYPALGLPADENRRRQLAALARWVLGGARSQPLVMAIEDVHWADPSTLELLRSLADQGAAAPLLLLLTARPEFKASWPHRSHHSVVTLTPLGSRDTIGMISAIASRHALSAETVDTLVARVAGVPLFIEEVTRLLLEGGDPKGSQDVPPTLRASLMARLDRLGPAKDVAQVGAVLGREFGWPLIKAMAGLADGPLQAALERLAETDLLQVEGMPPDSRYRFKHALVQDTAYEALLKSRRRELHRLAARTLPVHDKALAESHPELLAHHLTEAGDGERAAASWLEAGRRAADRSANLEAVAHFTRGVAAMGGLPETPRRDRLELDLHLALGPALMSVQGYRSPEAAEAYRRASALAERLDGDRARFAATWGLWITTPNGPREHEDRLDRLGELIEIADRIGDTELSLQAHHSAAATSLFTGDYARGQDQVRRTLALYDSDKHRHHAMIYGGHDPGVCAKCQGAINLWVLGYPDQAGQAARESILLAESLGHISSVLHALRFASIYCCLRQDVAAARECGERLLALGHEHGMTQYFQVGGIVRGWTLAQADAGEESLSELRTAVTAYGATANFMAGLYLALLAEAEMQVGNFERAAAALSAAEEFNRREWHTELTRLKGDLLWKGPSRDGTGAEQAYRQAIAMARGQEAKSLELRAATALARLLQDRGERAAARDTLAPIHGWFTEGHDTPLLIEAGTLLRELG